MSNLDEQKIDQLFLTISYINSLEQLLICLETAENSKLEIKKIYLEYYEKLKTIVPILYHYQNIIQIVYQKMIELKSCKEKYEYEVICDFYKRYNQEFFGYQKIKK